MNCNEIRFYLHNYDRLKKEIENLKESLTEYRKMNISGMKAQVITDMPTTHNNVSQTELMALTRIDYIRDLENEIDSKMRLVRAIESVYFYLQEPARTIFEMRYFISPKPADIRKPNYNWLQIAMEVKYSEDYCKEIDGKVVRKIQERFLKNIPQSTHVNRQTA